MLKKSRGQAILEGRCPRCRKGNMFVYPFSNFLKFYKMHTHCPVCGLRFEIEPGFFFGSMYISYIFSVGILLGSSFLLYFTLNDPKMWVYIVVIPLVTLLFLPFLFRYSRIVYMYLFSGISYNNKYSN